MTAETVGLGYQRVERRLVYTDRALFASIGQEIATACNDPLLRYVGWGAARLHASVLNGNEFARVAQASGKPIAELRTGLANRLGVLEDSDIRVQARINGFKFVGPLDNKPAFTIDCEPLSDAREIAVKFALDEGGLVFENDDIHVTMGEIRSLRKEEYEKQAQLKIPTRAIQFGPMNINDILSRNIY